MPGYRINFFRIHGIQNRFHAAQIKEQLALRLGRGDFDQPPVAQNEFMDFRLDPVYRKRDQSHAAFRIKALDRFHEPNVAFLDQVSLGQTIAFITSSNGDHHTQMGQHQLAGGLDVAFIPQRARQGGILLPVKECGKRLADWI